MHTDDAMELRITWEEAQDLLRPSPTAELTVVMVEDHEFEEFEVSFTHYSDILILSLNVVVHLTFLTLGKYHFRDPLLMLTLLFCNSCSIAIFLVRNLRFLERGQFSLLDHQGM